MFRRRRPRRFDELTRTSVVLHLTSGRSLAGILIGEYEDAFVLASARMLGEARGETMPLDGEVVVPTGKVEFAQAGVAIDDTGVTGAAT